MSHFVGCAIVQLPELAMFIYQYIRKVLLKRNSVESKSSTGTHTEGDVTQITVVSHKREHSEIKAKTPDELKKRVEMLESELAIIKELV